MPQNTIKDAWIRLNAFYVMGGFKLENLPENYRESFRQAQLDFIELVHDSGQKEAALVPKFQDHG
jgi:hypothetical protein